MLLQDRERNADLFQTLCLHGKDAMHQWRTSLCVQGQHTCGITCTVQQMNLLKHNLFSAA